jgi:hypothetical protein
VYFNQFYARPNAAFLAVGRVVHRGRLGLELRPQVLGHLRREVPLLVRQAPLPRASREALVHRRDQPAGPVGGHQQRVFEPAPLLWPVFESGMTSALSTLPCCANNWPSSVRSCRHSGCRHTTGSPLVAPLSPRITAQFDPFPGGAATTIQAELCHYLAVPMGRPSRHAVPVNLACNRGQSPLSAPTTLPNNGNDLPGSR